MKAAIIFILLIPFTISVHTNDCPDTLIPADDQDDCKNYGKKCTSKLGGVGKCVAVSNSGLLQVKCCPDPTLPDVFQTNKACSEALRINTYKLAFCKNGKIHTIGLKHLKVDYKNNINCRYNADCQDKNGYCVSFVPVDGAESHKCFVIDSPKEEKDNTLLIIIIVVVVIVLIAIIGIVVGILVCKKMKKGKGGHKSSAENGKKGKSSKKGKTEKTTTKSGEA